MCRSIRRLFNYEPPATDEEIRAAALQFVRKVSGSARPSQRNAEVFDKAVGQISSAVQELIVSMQTEQPPRSREADAAQARQRSAARFSREGT